uniref:WSN domain-containing protein n=1 Tax=Caenorhabditis tropicalis TaxID=1561998 RepID=A0A1I7U948_9PELO
MESEFQDFEGSGEGSGEDEEALSHDSPLLESPDLQNLLNTTINSSMVEYLLPSIPSIKKALSGFENQEFTVGDLLKKLDIKDWISLKPLLDHLGINLLNSTNSGILDTFLSSSGDSNLLNSSPSSMDSSSPSLQNILDSNDPSMLLGLLKSNPKIQL